MTDLHLTLHATVGDDGRYVVRDDTGKVVFTCQPGQSYEVPADRTLVFPHVVAKRHAEVAIDRQNNEVARDRRIAALLKLNSSHDGWINRVIELGEDCYIVELAGFWAHKDGPSWKVIIGGAAEHLLHLSLDLALLRAVELRNMAMSDDFSGRGFEYAARMLNVPAEG